MPGGPLKCAKADVVASTIQSMPDAAKASVLASILDSVPDDANATVAASAVRNVPELERAHVATAAFDALPPSARAQVATSTAASLLFAEQADLVDHLGGPDQRVTNDIWRYIVLTLESSCAERRSR